MVVTSVDARVSATPVLGCVRLDGSGAVAALGVLEEGGVLGRLGLVGSTLIAGRFALLRNGRWVKAGGDNVLSEAGGMDAHIVDAGEARVLLALAREAAAAVLALGRGAGLGGGNSADDNIGVDVLDRARFVGGIATVFVNVVAMRVAMVMAMVVVVAVFFVTMIVAVAAEDNKAEEVGDEASGTDNEDELGLGNLGGLD